MTNGKVSEQGLQQIRDQYEKAKREEWRLQQEYQNAAQHSQRLLHALSCPHDELEDASTDGIMQTRCLKCGFIWAE